LDRLCLPLSEKSGAVVVPFFAIDEISAATICVTPQRFSVLTRIRNCVARASLNGFLSFGKPPSLAHTPSKAGIIGMTRHVAMEGRGHGIRANSISPGLIETNQTRERLKDPEWARAMPGKTITGSSGTA